MKPILPVFGTIVFLTAATAIAADANWAHNPGGTDDLTGEAIPASVSVPDTERLDRAKSFFLLTTGGDGGLIAVIGLSDIDRFPGQKEVTISYRADGSQLQKATTWKLEGPRTAYREVTADEAKALFGGQFIIAAVDQTGKRYRYKFGDKGGLADAIQKVINSAKAR